MTPTLAVVNGLALTVAFLLFRFAFDVLRFWQARLVSEVIDECDRRGMARPTHWPYTPRS